MAKKQARMPRTSRYGGDHAVATRKDFGDASSLPVQQLFTRSSQTPPYRAESTRERLPMKMTNNRLLATLLLLCCLPAVASAREYEIYLGGLAQPQLKWEQQDPNVTETNPRNSGFALHRARLIAAGSLRGYSILWEARIEAEMVPSFQLLDAWLSASGELTARGHWRIMAGQQ
ncbi:MAG: hypothetical protein ACXVDD_07630, partial [Polyangia bacterium]